ncbi:MAG: MFS transporter [Halioglobus sp.]
MWTSFRTVWLLALANAVSASAFPLMMLIGSIIGASMAPAPKWATLPIALMVIGTACGVLPATRAMARLGRKPTFIVFNTIGVLGCLLAGQALVLGSFELLCSASFLLGITNASIQQMRFAAMESVALEQGPTAASIVMCSGIIAAFLGPEMALLGQNLSNIEYRGSFWLGAGCFLIGSVLLILFYRPAPLNRSETHSTTARPLLKMLHNRSLILAIASGAVAFVVMSFVMTATPVSMHMHHGHSMADTKFVIQSHIAAMFLPSLLTALLFRFLAIRGLMLAGLACYGLMIGIGLVDSSVMGFWGQLVILGIGWNFLFVAGTALLPTAYKEGEQFRAQAMNDTVVFGTQAIASLSAGWALSLISWQQLLLLCLVPMSAMVIALLWHRDPL